MRMKRPAIGKGNWLLAGLLAGCCFLGQAWAQDESTLQVTVGPLPSGWTTHDTSRLGEGRVLELVAGEYFTEGTAQIRIVAKPLDVYARTRQRVNAGIPPESSDKPVEGSSVVNFRASEVDFQGFPALRYQFEMPAVPPITFYVATFTEGFLVQTDNHNILVESSFTGPDMEKWRGEIPQVLAALRFDEAPVAPGPEEAGEPILAIIHLPTDLKPGDVLSPSYTISAADGGPLSEPVWPTLYINGQAAHSVIWDGSRTTVELRVTYQGRPKVVSAVLPAYGEVAAGPVPGLGGIGDLPGPADMTQALVGVLAPGLVAILIGLLGGLAPAPPGSPMTGGGPAEGPRSGPDDKENTPPPPRSAAELAAGLAPSRRPLTVIGGLQLPDFPEFPPDAGIAGGTPLLDPGAETLADKLMNAVGYVVENPYVQATGQTIADAGTALKDGVGGFLQGLAMIPQGIVSTIGNILSGYVEIGRLGREIYNDVSSGRSIIGGRSIVGVGLDTLRRSWDDLWSSVGREMLPVEELKSLFDRNASLEERLWAFPAAVVKGARLLMLPALRGVAASPVPGLGKVPSLIPSVRTAQSLEQLASMQHARTAAAEKKLAEIRADRSIRPGKQRSLTRPLEASLTEARNAEATIRGVGDLNGIAPDVAKSTTYQQVQRVLEKNPRLSRVVDDLIRNNDGGQTLYDLRRAGLMGKDAHTLITARKLQIQDQVMQAAQRRMLIEEARAILEQGGKPPTSFQTFNATQGSRTLIRGSNVNADLDSTMLGLKHVTKERSAQILREEAARAGFSQRSLDVNIYRPQVGLADPGGAAPNVQVTLENIGQTTGTGGRYQVHVTAKGKVVVSPHISQQGRESVLQARLAQGGGADSPGLMAWEGHQGRPVTVPREQWPLVREIQLDGLRHAYESGEMNQMVKYANRAQSVGLPLDAPTARLLRAVAGQKDPYLADQLLRRAGIRTPDDLMVRLGHKAP